MAVSISAASRLQFAELRIIDGITFWDLAELPAFTTRPTDMFHRVLGSDRIDTLANDYYGDEEFWWVIAWANDLEILPTDLNEGAIIVIPDPEFVRGVLIPGASNGS
jgi:hypothetical protein